jgi:predicted ester cyclase
MSAEQNKAAERRIISEMNNGNWGIVDDAFSPDFIYHGPFGMETRGLADFKKLMGEVMTTFPDFHMTIEDMIAEGDKLSVRLTCRCTHKGKFINMEPTGKQAVFAAVLNTNIVDGKRVQSWDIWDTASFLQQLGMIPALS